MNQFGSDRKRLGSALLASFGVNALLWSAFGSAILGQKAPAPTTIEISRIVISKKGEKITKTVTPKQIERRVQKIRREIVRRRPRPRIQRTQLVKRRVERPRVERPLEPSRAKPRPRAPEAPQSNKPVAQPRKAQPEGARNRTLVAKNRAATDAGQVKAGGNADLGKPLESQNFGKAKNNPKNYATPAPQPQPTQAPELPATPQPYIEPTPRPLPTATPRPAPTPAPTPTPRPAPTPTPKPEPTATPRPEPTPTPRPRPTPRPEPTPTPRPKGPTRDARATRTVRPSIPDELKSADFKTSVRVRVEVSADGSPSPSLRGSSGNAEIDNRVLAALRRWRWKPALKEGEAVASTQYFRFDFEVR